MNACGGGAAILAMQHMCVHKFWHTQVSANAVQSTPAPAQNPDQKFHLGAPSEIVYVFAEAEATWTCDSAIGKCPGEFLSSIPIRQC